MPENRLCNAFSGTALGLRNTRARARDVRLDYASRRNGQSALPPGITRELFGPVPELMPLLPFWLFEPPVPVPDEPVELLMLLSLLCDWT